MGQRHRSGPAATSQAAATLMPSVANRRLETDYYAGRAAAPRPEAKQHRARRNRGEAARERRLAEGLDTLTAFFGNTSRKL